MTWWCKINILNTIFCVAITPPMSHCDCDILLILFIDPNKIKNTVDTLIVNQYLLVEYIFKL